MNEKHPQLSNIIDFVLAHVPKNVVEATYNRAEYIVQHRTLHQEYADMLFEGFPPPSALLDGPRR